MMGSVEYDNEKPIHQVTLDGFYLQKTPVTYWQYFMFMQQDGLQVGKPDWGRSGDNPAVYVSWEDAARFCNWLSAQDGLVPVYTINGGSFEVNWHANGYRLTTEAEWEYAARGGKEQKSFIYSGSDNLDEVGWYPENAKNRTHPVRLKNPNTLGMYDMSGNVWEWCQDWYDEDYYKISPSSNPKGPNNGSRRVYRGGSWNGHSRFCRTTIRYGNSPLDRSNFLGFRLARTLFQETPHVTSVR